MSVAWIPVYVNEMPGLSLKCLRRHILLFCLIIKWKLWHRELFSSRMELSLKCLAPPSQTGHIYIMCWCVFYWFCGALCAITAWLGRPAGRRRSNPLSLSSQVALQFGRLEECGLSKPLKTLWSPVWVWHSSLCHQINAIISFFCNNI